MSIRMLALFTVIFSISTSSLSAQDETAGGGIDLDAFGLGDILGGTDPEKAAEAAADGGNDPASTADKAMGGEPGSTADANKSAAGGQSATTGTTGDPAQGGADQTDKGDPATGADSGATTTGDPATGTDSSGDPSGKEDKAIGGDDDSGSGSTKTTTGTDSSGKEDKAIGGETDSGTTPDSKPPLGSSGGDKPIDLGGLLGGALGSKGGSKGNDTLFGGSIAPKGGTKTTTTTPKTTTTKTTTPNITVNIPKGATGGGKSTHTKEIIYRDKGKKSKNNAWLPALTGMLGVGLGAIIGSSGNKKKGGCIPGKGYRWDPNQQRYRGHTNPTHICNNQGVMSPIAGTRTRTRAAPAQQRSSQYYSYSKKRGYYADPKGKFFKRGRKYYRR